MTPLSPSTGAFYARAKTQMGTLMAEADRLQTNIATTKRLQAPSDDAVAFGRLQRIAQAGTDAGANGANLDLAGSLLKQADTALAAIGDRLTAAAELVTRAATGTLDAGARKAIGAELAQVVDAMVQIANTADTRGQPMFGGRDATPAVTRVGDAFTFAPGTPGAIPIGEGQVVQPGEPAARVFALSGDRDVLAVLAAVAAALTAGEPVAAGVLDDLKEAGDQVSLVRGSLGARAARVEVVQAQADAVALDREAERSGLEDTDVAATYADLQKTLTVLSATQASFGKLSQLSLFDYLR